MIVPPARRWLRLCGLLMLALGAWFVLVGVRDLGARDLLARLPGRQGISPAIPDVRLVAAGLACWGIALIVVGSALLRGRLTRAWRVAAALLSSLMALLLSVEGAYSSSPALWGASILAVLALRAGLAEHAHST